MTWLRAIVLGVLAESEPVLLHLFDFNLELYSQVELDTLARIKGSENEAPQGSARL